VKHPIIMALFVAAAHFVASFVLFFISFGELMSRFDNGEPASVGATILDTVLTVLHFPVLTVVDLFGYPAGSTLSEYAPFVINSLLWGCAVAFAIRYFRAAA